MGTPVYLDNHSTTRCDPRVVEVMLPFFTEIYGNAASRSHRFGTDARSATERARGQLARWVNASPKEIVFTSGATEADNLALLGAARARREEGKRHVVTVATEHPAVLDTCKVMEREGFAVTILPVDSQGLVDPDTFVRALRPDTALASVMLVNNEIGVLQPLALLGRACRERGIWMHCDAAQAAYVPIDLEKLPIDLLSVSAHKIYGPKGIGALVVRRKPQRIRLEALIHGGGHERGLRSGTLAVPLIVGFGVAAELCTEDPDGPARVERLRDQLLDGLRAELDGLELLGHPEARAPNNLNLAFQGVEAAALLVAVRDEVALSTGSACSSETLAPSHVLLALGIEPEVAHRAVRFGLGRFTTAEEIERATAALVGAVKKLRAMSSLYEG
jgi:cysteine desulfurase